MIYTSEQRKAVKDAFKGTDRDILQKGLNSTENTVTQIVNGLLVVSPLRAKEIECLTKGKVKKSVLRPDVFGKNI